MIQLGLKAAHPCRRSSVAHVSHAAFVGVCAGASDFDARTITHDALIFCGDLARASSFRLSKRHYVAVGIARGGEGGEGRGEEGEGIVML